MACRAAAPEGEPEDALSSADAEGHRRAAHPVDQLFRDHNRELLRFLQARLGSEDEARDVAQQAYVRLLQLENVGAVSFLRAYLFRIAANLATDRLQAQRRMPRAGTNQEALLREIWDPLTVERTVMASEELALFMKFLDELPPRCRQAFVLQRVGQLSTPQVAKRLAISDRMVRKHITRALIYCRLRLDGLTQPEARTRLGAGDE